MQSTPVTRLNQKPIDMVIVVPSISRKGGGVSEVVRVVNSALSGMPEVRTEIWAFWDDESVASLSLYGSTRIRLFKPFLSKRFAFAPLMLFGLIKRRPDVVYVHGLWMFHCLAVYLWSVLTNGRYSVVPHGMLEPWIMARSSKLKATISTLYQNAFLKRAAFVQTLTTHETRNLESVVGHCREKLIPNFVEPPPERGRFPNWFDSSLKHKKIYLYFGRIHTKKGCLELLQAWGKACVLDENFRSSSILVFAGWIDGIDDFSSKVSELQGRYGNVRYIGPQYGEDRAATIAAATFLVLPSYSEGLPMVILEAWSQGKPSLMTEACNLPEGFSSGAALKINTGEDELAEAIVTSSKMGEAELNGMGQAALDLVCRRFSRTAVVNALLDAFLSVLKRDERS